MVKRRKIRDNGFVFYMFDFISIASDHAGFEKKEALVKHLQRGLKENQNLLDLGPDTDKSTNYTKYAHLVSRDVNGKEDMCGILLCGTGNGMSMTANKYKSIRAALCWSVEMAIMARRHNDANILCLPARMIGTQKIKQIADAFLSTPFDGGRHVERVRSIPIRYG